VSKTVLGKEGKDLGAEIQHRAGWRGTSTKGNEGNEDDPFGILGREVVKHLIFIGHGDRGWHELGVQGSQPWKGMRRRKAVVKEDYANRL